ncbi:MAG: GGDEF domain-containing protein [Bacillota bacterium]|uniref:Diguanylate cyclase n=1 Tax=Thermanaerosceptrum fracticalcis TaxID=1712410 RepID=A0A7G6E275_THEFR|nr:GGDEF domain-containing protein [Thermanaerosceptrum fracticalcis]QNB46179.1 diguanylate cyclase [Thermanaerosceptrum fracticalcis]
MEMDEKRFREEYLQEISQITLKYGTIFSGLVFPAVTIIMFIELLTYESISLVVCRVLFLIPMGVFLICTYSTFRHNLKMVIPLHALSLTGGMLMMTGLTVIKYKSEAFSPAYKIASLTGGLVTVIFLAFLFSAGARRYLIYIVSLPLIALLIVFSLDKELTWKEIAFFVNPVGAGLAAIVFSIIQEKFSYQEFKMKKLAEIRKIKLEEEIEERKHLEKKLQEKVARDDLTGVFNRRAALSFLEKHVEECRLNKEALTICYIDLDNLKKVNDIYGHAAGDKMIVNFTEILKKNTRDCDYVCRIGGDEFLIIFPSCTAGEAEKIIDRVRNVYNSKRIHDHIKMDFSYGFAEYSMLACNGIAEFIELADNNMYKHKLQKNIC